MPSESFPRAPHPDAAATDQLLRDLRHRQPRCGSLGLLSPAIAWWAGCSGLPLRAPSHVALVVVAGRHGWEDGRVCTLTEADTDRSCAEITEHCSPADLLGVGAEVTLCDLRDVPVAPSNREDALTEEDMRSCMERGRREASRAIDSGADLLVPGSLGAAELSTAATLVGALCQREPVSLYRTGNDPELWKRQVAATRDALFRVSGRGFRAGHRDPHHSAGEHAQAVLRRLGSPATAALTGFLIEAAQRRTPVLLDGMHPLCAALIAERCAPGSAAWMYLSCHTTEPLAEPIIEALELQPMTITEAELPAGIGSLMALPQLNAGIALCRGSVEEPEGPSAEDLPGVESS